MKNDEIIVEEYWDTWRKKKYRRKPRVVRSQTGKKRGWMPHKIFLKYLYDSGRMYPELKEKYEAKLYAEKLYEVEERARLDCPDDFDEIAYMEKFDRPDYLDDEDMAKLIYLSDKEYFGENLKEKKEEKIRAILKEIKEGYLGKAVVEKRPYSKNRNKKNKKEKDNE